MVCTLVIGMSISAFAAANGFVSSPSTNTAPVLVSATNVEGCSAQIVITAYGNRNTLPENVCKQLEDAYAAIVAAGDLSTLNSDVAAIAESLGVSASDLAVSDLFDISSTACDDHNNHGHFDITLKSEYLKNFVCLLHYYTGTWRIVDNAEVTNNGTHLEFDEKEFSPFAIVVSTKDLAVQPGETTQPGEDTTVPGDDIDQPDGNNLWWILIIIAILLIAIAIVVAVTVKKKSESEKK